MVVFVVRMHFHDSSFLSQTSAISRKLDVIHQVLLKRADHTLYAHLKELSIPAPDLWNVRKSAHTHTHTYTYKFNTTTTH